jgi:FMN phosphatase YigB (HAD superfamily)
VHSTSWLRLIGLLPFYILIYHIFAFPTRKTIESSANSTIVFAWDFHEVLVNKQKWPMIKKAFSMVMQAQNRWSLIWDFINPWFWADVKYARKKYQTTDGIFNYLKSRHPELEEIMPEFYELLRLYTPNQEMIALLDTLSAQGYRHYLASNISDVPLADMQAQYPDLFARFAGIYRFEHPKPAKEYYISLQEYIRQLEGDCQIDILFIDDMKPNITGAMKSGTNIDAIHFISPRQLRQELQKRGFSFDAAFITELDHMITTTN